MSNQANSSLTNELKILKVVQLGLPIYSDDCPVNVTSYLPQGAGYILECLSKRKREINWSIFKDIIILVELIFNTKLSTLRGYYSKLTKQEITAKDVEVKKNIFTKKNIDISSVVAGVKPFEDVETNKDDMED